MYRPADLTTTKLAYRTQGLALTLPLLEVLLFSYVHEIEACQMPANRLK